MGSFVLWALGTAVAFGVVRAAPLIALLAGALVVLLHWISDLVHQVGHATAAHYTGYPASGIRLWGVLSTIRYPEDEPPLPAALHARRALGGPLASALCALVSAVLVVALRPIAGTAWWLLVFLLLDNLLVFTLGAFLPLGFTDGGTLLRLRQERVQDRGGVTASSPRISSAHGTPRAPSTPKASGDKQRQA
jgi:hypothetical protein